MAKNIVRKSLSILSASVLGATVLVAAPAAHATQLKLEPSSGTLYAVPHKTDFELKVTANPGFSNAELQFLKFKVDTAGGINIRVATGTSTTSATNSTTVLVDNTETTDETAAVNASSGGVGFIALYATNAAGSDYAVDASNVTATVTAWVDKDQDDVVDSGEWQAAQTVTWMDADLLTPTFTLVQPVLAETTVVARLTSTQINLAQSSSRFVVDFTGPSSFSSPDRSASYDSALDRVSFTSGSTTVAAGTYSANLEIDESSDVDVATVSRSVSSTTVSAVSASADAGANSAALASNSSNDSVNIRAGSGSLVYTVKVVNSSSVGISGAVVTLTASETAINNIEAAATISVGGQTLRNASVTTTEDISVTGTTDVNGEVSFTVSWSALGAVSAGDPFSLRATIDGRSGGVDTFTTVDAAATKLFSADIQNASAGQLVVAVGQPFSLTYHLTDQFGQLLRASGYSVTATDSAVSATGVFNNGVATVTFPGYAAANAGAKSITTSVTNTLGLNTSGVTDSDAEFTVFVGAPNAPASVTIAGTFGTASSKSALNTARTADADVRFGTSTTAPTSEITDATATVRDANGNGVRSRVTFSGSNLIFKSATGIYKKGSITVWTNASGVADVDISSQSAGTQVLTVTAGGVSSTQNIVFADAAATSGTTWTFTVPSTVTPGSTFRVVGTLTDRFGNPVRVTDTADVAVTYDGPGLVSGSMPNTTNASGQFSFWVLVGANDRGVATITASYDQSSDGDFTGVATGDVDVVSSVTVTLGAGAIGAAKVNVGSFNGKLVVYANGHNGKRISWKVNGRWGSAVASSNTARFERPTPRRGVTVSVEIYVDGVKQLTKSVVTR